MAGVDVVLCLCFYIVGCNEEGDELFVFGDEVDGMIEVVDKFVQVGLFFDQCMEVSLKVGYEQCGSYFFIGNIVYVENDVFVVKFYEVEVVVVYFVVWFVDVVELIVVGIRQLFGNEYVLYFVCQFYFLFEVFLFQLVFEQVFVFDSYSYDIGNGSDELYFVVYVIFFVKVINKDVGNGFFFVLYWDDYIKMVNERVFFFVYIDQVGIFMELFIDFWGRDFFFNIDICYIFLYFVIFILYEECYFFYVDFLVQERLVYIEQFFS